MGKGKHLPQDKIDMIIDMIKSDITYKEISVSTEVPRNTIASIKRKYLKDYDLSHQKKGRYHSY